MLTCKEVAEQADAMLDGETSWWLTLQIRFHLVMCKGCYLFMDRLQKTRALIDRTSGADGQSSLSPADELRITAILAGLHDGDRSEG